MDLAWPAATNRHITDLSASAALHPFISSRLDMSRPPPFHGPHICFSFASQQPNAAPRRLFRTSAATSSCAFPVPGDLIDSGLRQSSVCNPAIGSGSPFFAAGLPGMDRHAFGPPAARRCSRDTTHFLTVPLRPFQPHSGGRAIHRIVHRPAMTMRAY